jgi:thiamine-phosphate pyrophosphorylase
MQFTFPKVYPILDSSVIPATGRADFLRRLGVSLTDAGVTLMEYRNKTGSDTAILNDAAILRASMPAGRVKLILDDRADLVDQAAFDGVHVDAGDISPAQARSMLGSNRIVGTFGGSDALLHGILDAPADYLAIGPVFQTRTKLTDKKPIGIDGVQRLRSEAGSGKVLSAAAGITIDTAKAVLDAGASMVAVSEAIFHTSDPALTFSQWVRQLQ